MPELAEVEHARKVWAVGLGAPVREALVPRPTVRVLREVDAPRLRRALAGARLVLAEARGKQLLFGFAPARARGGAASRPTTWLGVHLGMRGHLEARPPGTKPGVHDLLVLRQAARDLVFTDLRHFGRVRLHEGAEPPAWWTDLPPPIASAAFTRAKLDAFLARRGARNLKGLLLEQGTFPGVGNWMADEILWRARLHPERLARDLDARGRGGLFRAVRFVARESIRRIGDDWEYPATWLFAHRWADGGSCPRCGASLVRRRIAGRTTAFCPRCQPAPRGERAPLA